MAEAYRNNSNSMTRNYLIRSAKEVQALDVLVDMYELELPKEENKDAQEK